MTLGGLGPRDVATLVKSVDSAGVDSSGTVTRLHRQSGGNPFFLWELLQLERSGGGVDAAPPGVRAVVSRRLQRLSETARGVLAAASVLGGKSICHS